MPQAAAVSASSIALPPGVSAVVSICSSRKFQPPASALRAGALPQGEVTKVAAAWLERLHATPPSVKARDLYGGRAFRLARQAAVAAGADFLVISAGLGLVRGDRSVPSYALTTSGRGDEAIAPRITDIFLPRTWFAALSASPYATTWSDVFARGAGLVLCALTRPYAQLVADQLVALPYQDRARLRIFGESLTSVLPEALHAAVMPYDRRLDTVAPGTRADFPQRALADFASDVAPGSAGADAAWHAAAVRRRLSAVEPPARPERPRMSDDEIKALIRARLPSERGIGRLLRALRDKDGVACEQARFSRLYRQALQAEEGR